MIDESVLERLLRDEAEAYPPPADGPARVLDAAAAQDGVTRRPGRGWLMAGAAAAVLVAAGLVVSQLPLRGGGGPAAITERGYVPGGSTGVGAPHADADGDGAGPGDQVGGGGGNAGGKLLDAAPNDLLVDGAHVVRTGDVALEVPKERVRDALRDVTRLAATHGGYVSESKAEIFDDAPSGYVTIRVPVAAFDKALEDLGRIGDIRHSGTSGEDVGTQVADTEARLRSATATRAQLRTLLSRATDIGDVLAVQSRIDEVQTEIEKLQAAQASLKDRTAYGTLRVSVSDAGAAEDREGFARAWHEAVDGFVGGFQTLVAASGTIAFLLIVGTLLFLLARRAYRFWVRGVV